MKNKTMFNLISLYLYELFQKKTIIVFSISLGLMIIIDFLLAKPFDSSSRYLANVNDYHNFYFTESLFITEIFNTIMLSAVVLSLTVLSNSFDSFYIPLYGRYKIAIAKLIVITTIILILTLFEGLIIYGIAIFRFKLYTFDYRYYYSFYCLFISLVFEVIVGMAISQSIGIIFVPFVTGFGFILLKVICNNFSDFSYKLSYVIPNLFYDEKSSVIITNNGIISLLWVLLFGLIYCYVYNIKDIREK